MTELTAPSTMAQGTLRDRSSANNLRLVSKRKPATLGKTPKYNMASSSFGGNGIRQLVAVGHGVGILLPANKDGSKTDDALMSNLQNGRRASPPFEQLKPSLAAIKNPMKVETKNSLTVILNKIDERKFGSAVPPDGRSRVRCDRYTNMGGDGTQNALDGSQLDHHIGIGVYSWVRSRAQMLKFSTLCHPAKFQSDPQGR